MTKLWREPLDKAQMKVPLGAVHIMAEQCKGCGFCVEFCPREVLALSESYNKKGYHPPVVVKEGACLDCRLCEIICPEFSIYVTLDNDQESGVENALTLIEEAETVAN